MIIRKILSALVIALCFTCPAFADESDDVLSSDVKLDKSGNIIDFTTKDGLRIIYIGTFRINPEVSLDVEGERDDSIFSVFMVKSNKDTQLQLDVRDGYDTRTNKFSWRTSAPWGYIADIDVNGNARDILDGFWVRVTFWHNLPFKYGEYPVIARVGFVINGNEIMFKRIRPRPYNDWKNIEDKIFVLEENETEMNFQLEELESKSEN